MINFLIFVGERGVSSVGSERMLDRHEVTGSIPVHPTELIQGLLAIMLKAFAFSTLIEFVLLKIEIDSRMFPEIAEIIQLAIPSVSSKSAAVTH